MKKKLKITFTLIFSVSCFLGALIIGVPLVIGKIFWPNIYSMHVTLYIFLAYMAFFLVFLGVIIPFARRIFNYLKIRKAKNIIDGFATILLVITSAIPLIIVTFCTIILLKIKKLYKYRYRIADVFAKITSFLCGVWIKTHGVRSKEACFNPINHTSPLDYLLTVYTMGPEEWNAMAGINLVRNKASLEDKIVSRTIGPMIDDYLITVDRDNENSKIVARGKMITENKNGKNVAIFSEGGRIPYEELLSGKILREFEKGAFIIAYRNNIPIQPIVFDWPVMWRGKNEKFWGIHPFVIVDIYYLDVIRPRDFDSFEAFFNACCHATESQLKKSKKIKNFLKYNKSPQK